MRLGQSRPTLFLRQQVIQRAHQQHRVELAVEEARQVDRVALLERVQRDACLRSPRPCQFEVAG